MESNQSAFELDFFLNLADCSTEEKNLLETILKKTPSSGPTGDVATAVQLSAPVPVSAPPQASSSTAACPPTTTLVATSKFAEATVSLPEGELNNFIQPQQQQQQQHHGMQGGNNEIPPMQHQMYEYPTSSGNMGEYASTPQTSAHAYSSYSATATGSPYVFINNVTANVNVHHGPSHLQDEQQIHQQHHLQQQHQQQQMQIQQQRYQQGQQMHHQGPPPMTAHPGPPPAALLPTPHFVPVVSQAGGYIAPFPNQQQPRMAKGNVGQQAMYPMPPMYPHHFLPFPAYGYVPQMMASIPQVPQQQALPRAQVPMMRAPTSLSQGHMFSPPPPLVGPVTIPLTEMAAFPAPPPSVTSAPLIVDGSQVQIIDHQQQLLQAAHHQQVEVSTSLTSQQSGPVEVQPEQQAEPEKELRFTNDEEESESFGFVVDENQSEGEEDEGIESPPQGVTESASQEDQAADYRDVPTPVQDEPVEVNEVAVKAPESAPQQHQEESRTPVAKSWASLFHTENHSNAERGYSSKPMALIHPYTGDLGEKMGAGHGKGDLFPGSGMSVALGRKEAEMAAHLQGYVLNHKAQSLKPRGLSNRSNWCFVNAIMQALVACPPFFNLMKSLPAEIMYGETIHLLNSPLKILAAVNAFVAEFTPLENFPRMNHHRRDKNKKPEDLPLGKTFEAATIFQVLLNLNSDTFKVIEGRQEDAEEFLTFLLNGLNDEMLSVLKLVNNNDCNNPTDEENPKVSKIEDEEGADEWQEVGPKNKSCITRRGGDLGGSCSIKTPLADMFQGQIRSCVQRTAGETTATLQPFFTLQLDIQSENIRNVADALTHNFCVETLDGYVCSRTKQEIEASRSLLLEELPPILVLHLKRFVYNETSGGCQKLLKNIDFPVDLEIPRDILSPNSKNKYASRQRQYKLFAVVYHNGTEATKGHYVADVYHTGLSTWLHCDDSSLKPLSENMVMAHSASSMPYILFYRRGDTMGGGSVSGAEKVKSTSSTAAAGASSNKSSSTQMT